MLGFKHYVKKKEILGFNSKRIASLGRIFNKQTNHVYKIQPVTRAKKTCAEDTPIDRWIRSVFLGVFLWCGLGASADLAGRTRDKRRTRCRDNILSPPASAGLTLLTTYGVGRLSLGRNSHRFVVCCIAEFILRLPDSSSRRRP